MKRSLLLAVLVQGFGALIAVLTVLGVSHFLGADAQGRFSIYKNWLELISLALLLGLPQGIVFAINKEHIAPASAERISLLFSVATTPLAWGASWLGSLVGYLPDRPGAAVCLGIAIGCSGYIYHGMARSVYLTRNDGMLFSLLTIAPTVGIAALITVLQVWDVLAMPLVFSVNGALCGFVAWLMIRPHANGTTFRSPRWRQVLLAQSIYSYASTLLTALQPLVVFAFMRHAGVPVGEIGVLGLALIIPVSLNSIVAMIAPILYNRWSQSKNSEALAGLVPFLTLAALGFGMPVTLIIILAAPLVGILGDHDFKGAIEIVQMLAISTVPLLYSRLSLPALLAVGAPSVVAFTTSIRVTVVFVMLSVAVLVGRVNLFAATLSWVAAEWFAALVLFVLISIRIRSSLTSYSSIFTRAG